MKNFTAGLSTLLCVFALAEIVDQPSPKKVGDEKQLREAVDPPRQGVAVLVPTRDSKVQGVVRFDQGDDALHLRGKIVGLEPGKHGFHIHEFGDISDPQGEAAGGHFNPTGERHGAPTDKQHHAGDLGNIMANQDGVATVDMKVPGLKLHFIVGRGLVVHAGADDLKSQPSGNAGARVAVGVIGIAKPEEKATGE